jgi:hypothetical protein
VKSVTVGFLFVVMVPASVCHGDSSATAGRDGRPVFSFGIDVTPLESRKAVRYYTLNDAAHVKTLSSDRETRDIYLRMALLWPLGASGRTRSELLLGPAAAVTLSSESEGPSLFARFGMEISGNTPVWRVPANDAGFLLLGVSYQASAGIAIIQDEDYNLGSSFPMYDARYSTGLQPLPFGDISLGLTVSDRRVRLGPSVQFLFLPEVAWANTQMFRSDYNETTKVMKTTTELTSSQLIGFRFSVHARL